MFSLSLTFRTYYVLLQPSPSIVFNYNQINYFHILVYLILDKQQMLHCKILPRISISVLDVNGALGLRRQPRHADAERDPDLLRPRRAERIVQVWN